MQTRVAQQDFELLARRGIAFQHGLHVFAQGFEHSLVSHFGIAFRGTFTLREQHTTILHFGFPQQRVCSSL